MIQQSKTPPPRAIQSLFRLLSINLTGKFVSVGVFVLLARTLDPVHLAFVGLVEPTSFLAIAIFCLGVITTLEKNVPRLLVTDVSQAKAMIRSAMLVMCTAILLMVVVSVLFVEYWSSILFEKQSFRSETIALFILPIAAYMFRSMLSVNFLVTGSTETYSRLVIYGNLTANISALGFYAYYPSDVAIFVGLAVGQLPFLLYGFFVQRKWFFGGKLYSLRRLILESRIYYLEGIFNTFRSSGDSLIVSSLLGPLAMAHYYVARTVAGQLNVFFQPLNAVIVHRFGMKLGEGQGVLEQEFSRVWGIAPTMYIWFAACYAASIPAVVFLFAGETYIGSGITSVVIAFVFLGVAILNIVERVLFVIGTSFERFRVTLVHSTLALALLVLTMSIATPTTVALAWLGATVVTLIFTRYRAKRIGFAWPTDGPIGRAILVSLPVPLIALIGMNYEGLLDLKYLFFVFLLSMSSLFVLILSQSDVEESEVLSLIPASLKLPYRFIRSMRSG